VPLAEQRRISLERLAEVHVLLAASWPGLAALAPVSGARTGSSVG
jgi:hypothetical protein